MRDGVCLVRFLEASLRFFSFSNVEFCFLFLHSLLLSSVLPRFSLSSRFPSRFPFLSSFSSLLLPVFLPKLPSSLARSLAPHRPLFPWTVRCSLSHLSSPLLMLSLPSPLLLLLLPPLLTSFTLPSPLPPTSPTSTSLNLLDPVTAARLSFVSAAILTNQVPSRSTVLNPDPVSPTFAYGLPKSTATIVCHPTFVSESGRIPFRTRRQINQALERRLIQDKVNVNFLDPSEPNDVTLSKVPDASVDANETS